MDSLIAVIFFWGLLVFLCIKVFRERNSCIFVRSLTWVVRV